MNEHQQFLQFHQKVVDFQQWIMDVLKALAEKNKNGQIHDKATDQLIRHMENGGKCASLSFPMDDIDFVEELFKRHKILAIEMSSVNPETNRAMRTYVFREQDLKQIQAIADDYLRHLDGKCHELDEETFVVSNQDRAYFTAAGLTHEEMNIFRENALKYNMDFIFVKDKNAENDTPYQVMANDKVALDKCLIDTYADLVGSEGKEYADKMEKFWESQNAMLEKLKSANGPVMIVDADNMNSVIEVANMRGKGKKYRTHYLGIRTERKRDGSTCRIPIDEGMTIEKDLDISIIEEMKQMKRPVILTHEEAVKWLDYQNRDKTGMLILPEVFADGEKMADFVEHLQKREILPIEKPLHAREERAREGLKTYSGLPYSVISALRREQIDGLYILGNDIAFTPEAEEKVKTVMREEYYQDAGPLEVIAEELRYMGRGAGKLHDLEKDEEYIVFDFQNPSHTIDITETKAVVSDGTEEVDLMAADFPVYEQKIVDAVALMQTPIIMSKEEYMSPDRNELAYSMLMSTKENVASLSAKTKDAERLERLYRIAGEMDNGRLTDITILSDEERELVERRKNSIVEVREAQTVEKVFENDDIVVEKDKRYREEYTR